MERVPPKNANVGSQSPDQARRARFLFTSVSDAHVSDPDRVRKTPFLFTSISDVHVSEPDRSPL